MFRIMYKLRCKLSFFIIVRGYALESTLIRGVSVPLALEACHASDCKVIVGLYRFDADANAFCSSRRRNSYQF
jgi:hypothetical protein